MRIKIICSYGFIVLLVFIVFTGAVRYNEAVPADKIISESSEPITTSATSATTTTTSESTTVTSTATTTTKATVASVSSVSPPYSASPRDLEYEKNIVFVGDSVCMGLRVYKGLLSADQVFAEGCVSARTINDYKFEYKGQTLTIDDCIRQSNPKYIYIWMGINDINVTTKEVYADNLHKLAERLITASPTSKIAIVSMTPTTATHKWQANGRINDYNSYVRDYFSKLDTSTYYYIDVHSTLVNENGVLPENYHSGDGLHLGSTAYNIVLGYISAHKIP